VILLSKLNTLRPHPPLRKGQVMGDTFLQHDGYVLELDPALATVTITHPDAPGRSMLIPWPACAMGEPAGYVEPPAAPPAALALPAPPTYPAPANTVPVDMSPEEREALIARTRRDPNAIPAALRPPAGSETVTSYLTREQAAGMSASALEAARADGAVIDGETLGLSAAEPATSAQTPSAKAPKDSGGGYPGQKRR
jgi:hypothetical protein